MNTDFRLSVGYFEHPKIMKLERRLGEGAVLSHIRLLRFASMNKPDGVLNGMDAEDVANAAGYKGDADALLSQLISVRLLDDDGGNLSLHDWEEWNPWAAGSKERTAKAKAAASVRWNGAVPKDTQSKPVASALNATSTIKQCPKHDLALPLSFPILSFPILSESYPLPNPSQEECQKTDTPPPAAGRARPSSYTMGKDFAVFWSAYPRKEGKDKAWEAWKRLAPGEELFAEMLAGIERAKEGEQWQRSIIPHPTTWITGKRWKDEVPSADLVPVRNPPGSLPGYRNGLDTSPEARRARNLAAIT